VGSAEGKRVPTPRTRNSKCHGAGQKALLAIHKKRREREDLQKEELLSRKREGETRGPDNRGDLWGGISEKKREPGYMVCGQKGHTSREGEEPSLGRNPEKLVEDRILSSYQSLPTGNSLVYPQAHWEKRITRGSQQGSPFPRRRLWPCGKGDHRDLKRRGKKETSSTRRESWSIPRDKINHNKGKGGGKEKGTTKGGALHRQRKKKGVPLGRKESPPTFNEEGR